MNRLTSLSAILGLFLTLTACSPEPTSGMGFRLPDGDPEEGKMAFIYMQCNQCHYIEGLNLPPVPDAEPYVELGGRVTHVKTYGNLVTSIINPSHKLASGYEEELIAQDGESNMYNYNRHMTVQELTDLVAFLQSHYDVVPPQFDYRVYPR